MPLDQSGSEFLGQLRGFLRNFVAFINEESGEPHHPPMPQDVNQPPTYPRQAAGTLLMAPDGRALFVRRNGTADHGGEWSLPGGSSEDAELPWQTALRETHEEVGDIGLTKDDLHLLDHSFDNGQGFTTYGAKVDEAFTPVLNNEHDAHQWLQLKDAPYPIHPGLKNTLDFATDPLTEKGNKILRAMQDQYGEEKGRQVFYASANKGIIEGVHDQARGSPQLPQPGQAMPARPGTNIESGHSFTPFGVNLVEPDHGAGWGAPDWTNADWADENYDNEPPRMAVTPGQTRHDPHAWPWHADWATDPPVSEAQRRAMHAAAHGQSRLGIPKSVGEEFAGEDPGGKLPESKGDRQSYRWEQTRKHTNPDGTVDQITIRATPQAPNANQIQRSAKVGLPPRGRTPPDSNWATTGRTMPGTQQSAPNPSQTPMVDQRASSIGASPVSAATSTAIGSGTIGAGRDNRSRSWDARWRPGRDQSYQTPQQARAATRQTNDQSYATPQAARAAMRQGSDQQRRDPAGRFAGGGGGTQTVRRPSSGPPRKDYGSQEFGPKEQKKADRLMAELNRARATGTFGRFDAADLGKAAPVDQPKETPPAGQDQSTNPSPAKVRETGSPAGGPPGTVTVGGKEPPPRWSTAHDGWRR